MRSLIARSALLRFFMVAGANVFLRGFGRMSADLLQALRLELHGDEAAASAGGEGGEGGERGERG